MDFTEIIDLEEKSECLSLMKNSLEKNFPKQFQYVIDRSDFYKKKFSKYCEVVSSYSYDWFISLPFTEKSEVLEDQILHPPFGSNQCGSSNDICRIHQTSGTTGRPLLLTYTKNDILNTTIAGKRCFISSGLNEEHTVMHCLNYSMWAGGVTDHMSLEATGASVAPFGVGNSKKLIEMIISLKANAIHCTPSYLSKLEVILLKEFDMQPSSLGLSLGLFGAEGGLENSNFRREIQNKWGIRAMNANYGMADVLSMFGAECCEQNGLHFMGQNIIYCEIIDPDTLNVLKLENGTIGELVLTNLCKEAQPMIRYRTRDIVKILDINPCQCGRSSFRFKIMGRSDDMIVVKGINVFVSAIASVINKHLDVFSGEFQIFVSKSNPIDAINLKIEKKSYIEITDNFKNQFLASLVNTIYLRPSVEFVSFNSLPRIDGKTNRLYRV